MSTERGIPEDGAVVDTARRLLLVASVLLAGLGSVAAATVGPDRAERIGVATVDDGEDRRPSSRAPAQVMDGGSTSSTTSAVTTTAKTRSPSRSLATTSTTSTQPASPVPTLPETDPDDVNGPDVVRGRITDETGRPVPDVCIDTGLPESADAPLLLARTDADGRYRIERSFMWAILHPCEDAPAGFGWSLDPPGIRRYDLAPGTVTHDIEVRRRGGVRGRVVDQSGRPVAGVVVHMCCAEFPGHEPTGPDGSFAIRNISPGPQPPWLHYRGPGPAQTPQEGAGIDVVGGQWNEVTIVLRPWVPWNGGY